MRATGPHRLAPSDDPVEPGATTAITVHVDGLPVSGLAGQTIAGVLLSTGRASWRTTRRGRPRGVFCGIGVCYDCLLTVNGLSDVRACQRRAADGDVITTKDEISSMTRPACLPAGTPSPRTSAPDGGGGA
ncbi:2Fe-2S iron-sulfur cluster-binding protein [Actinoplanes sp. TBRC 11911]|uniref:2Fe-2S iron-sulfur cluster-binding protein n=1 Tax=Actinoplanes sp. TBRC 11911 TaxID=2729386 RepID=UPI00289D9DCD|nr:2Fe-2S iron-sulfur cluster-binding protein [Actinoplanes sp. TBRC 11911]